VGDAFVEQGGEHSKKIKNSLPNKAFGFA